jgi:hypothetical protein
MPSLSDGTRGRQSSNPVTLKNEVRRSVKYPQASRFGWKLNAGQEIGVVGRIEIGMDRGEDRIWIALSKLDVAGVTSTMWGPQR